MAEEFGVDSACGFAKTTLHGTGDPVAVVQLHLQSAPRMDRPYESVKKHVRDA